MALAEYFATGPSHERPVFDAVMQAIAPAGPVHVEPVSVGLFLKNPAKFAELRPMTRWVSVSFFLRRRAAHRAITRKVVQYGDRYWHVANVTSPDDVDDAFGALLIEAYGVAGG
jgi:hypothetical protein